MKDYYKIGEISKMYGIGRDSLRYYEEIGILKPLRDTNGYRMYSMQDMWKLNIIKDLRNLDFPMGKIKDYLDHRTLESTKDILNDEAILLQKKINELSDLKSNIEQRLNKIKQVSQNIKINNINVTFINERKVFKLNGNISRDAEVDFLLKKLQGKHQDKFYLLGNISIGAKFCMNKIKEGIYSQYESVFFLFEKEELEYDEILDEGYYITLSYRGSYKQSKIHICSMLDFIERKRYKILSGPIEIYRIDIHETSKPEEFVTEIQIPIEI